MEEVTQGYAILNDIVEQIRKITNFVPKVGVVLGSGLGKFTEDIRVIGKIPYSKLNGFPVSTVPGHNGQFIFGYVNKIPVVLMDGRVHYYEGYDMFSVVMPERIMALLGAKVVILTNAAGGIKSSYYPGLLMAITDHISSFVPSPLIGQNIEEIGTRFPDMTNIYDEELKNLVVRKAHELQVPIREGVYLQTSGPNYETPTEIKMFKTLGADAVGMSTAVEAIALRHMGVRCCGISLITNMAAGINKAELNHDEVKREADAASSRFRKVLWEVIIGIVEMMKEEEKALKEASQPKKDTKKKNEGYDDLNFDDMEIIKFK